MAGFQVAWQSLPAVTRLLQRINYSRHLSLFPQKVVHLKNLSFQITIKIRSAKLSGKEKVKTSKGISTVPMEDTAECISLCEYFCFTINLDYRDERASCFFICVSDSGWSMTE